MNSVICTLFEGDYHFGVGALTNSLYANGFRGTIYAGYRGTLPTWVGKTEKYETRNQKSKIEGYVDFSPAEGLTLRFISLTTKVHLTNFKPDFMLEIWENFCPQAEAIFYFDPDITVKCRWTFFEEWVQGGVALCEDVNSPVPSSHPLRNAWRNYYGRLGRKLPNSLDIYVNGGFVGVTLNEKSFLKEWDAIQQEMSPAAENLMGWGLGDRTFAFSRTDQDALNITLMFTSSPFSLSGKDGMDLMPGGFIMSHSLGQRKPWRNNYLLSALKGITPSLADKIYWDNVASPIRVFSGSGGWCRRTMIRLAVLIGRFYRR